MQRRSIVGPGSQKPPFRERLPGAISRLGKGTALQRGRMGGGGVGGGGAKGVGRGGGIGGGSVSGGGRWSGSTSVIGCGGVLAGMTRVAGMVSGVVVVEVLGVEVGRVLR